MTLAFAHEGGDSAYAVTPWSAWTLDLLVVVPLVLAALLYWKGAASSWERAGLGRGVKRWEAASFVAGMAALFFALVWPLHELSEELFSAHMAQHVVLMNIAAPLLVLGAPLQVMVRALPRAWQRAAASLVQAHMWRAMWRSLSGLVAATLLHQIVLWAWHTPGAVAAALQNEWTHIAMHVSLVGVALLFWTAVLRPRSRHYWAPIAALLVTLKVSGAVCIVLLLQAGASYTAYGPSAAAWGLAPQHDEQLGWGVMMIAGTLGYLGAALALFAVSFARLERASPALGR